MATHIDAIAREYRIAPQYRRCAWYGMGGAVLVSGCTALLKAWNLGPPDQTWAHVGGITVFLSVISMGLLIFVYRWRLRLDETGLARRRFWNWDVWTWDELNSGQIERSDEGLLSSKRPFWRNKLSFVYLSESDRRFVRNACQAFYEPPAPPEVSVPDGNLKIWYQLLRTITLRPDGVSGNLAWGDFDLPWAEIEEVRLVIYDHWSTELRKIEFELPKTTVRVENVQKVFGAGKLRPRYSAADPIPQVVEAYLQRYVPPEKLARHALTGPPATLAECAHRRAQLQRQWKQFTWMWRIISPTFLALSLLCFGPKLLMLWRGQVMLPPGAGWTILVAFGFGSMIVCPLLMIGGLLYEIRKTLKKGIDELDLWENEQERVVSD